MSPSQRQFVKDYALPLAASILLFLVVITVFIVRNHERSTLASILPKANSDRSKDYAKLLSKDPTNELKKDEGDDQSQSDKDTPGSTDAPFTITSNAPPHIPGGSTNPVPTGPLMGSITYFRQEGSFMECDPRQSSSGSSLDGCSMHYVFGAAIQTTNGPGTVTYSWRSSHQPANASGSFSVGSGEAYTPLQKSIVLSCTEEKNFNLQLEMTTPILMLSEIIEVKHKCSNSGSGGN